MLFSCLKLAWQILNTFFFVERCLQLLFLLRILRTEGVRSFLKGALPKYLVTHRFHILFKSKSFKKIPNMCAFLILTWLLAALCFDKNSLIASVSLLKNTMAGIQTHPDFALYFYSIFKNLLFYICHFMFLNNNNFIATVENLS